MTSHEGIMGNAVMEGSQSGNPTTTHMHTKSFNKCDTNTKHTTQMYKNTYTQIHMHTPVLGAAVFLL